MGSITKPSTPLAAGGRYDYDLKLTCIAEKDAMNCTGKDEDDGAYDIEYVVYWSIADNITTLADAELDGTISGAYAADISSRQVTGPSPLEVVGSGASATL